MKSQDDIDTEPIVQRRGALSECREAEAGPGDRVEVEISPERPMVAPLLVISARPCPDELSVEQVACGNIVLAVLPRPAAGYKFGHRIGDLVTRDSPLRILFNNASPLGVKISACLVDSGKSPGAYSGVNSTEG